MKRRRVDPDRPVDRTFLASTEVRRRAPDYPLYFRGADTAVRPKLSDRYRAEGVRTMDLLGTAKEKATGVLHGCAHDRGFKAAANYYPQVWARDGVITSLGALTTDDPKLITAARTTLVSLAEFQCPETGRIASYIPIDREEVELPINEAFDSNLWYVIGHDAYHAKTGDNMFVEKHIESLRAAIRWARFMDSNNDGLIECHECADWKDTWDNSYHNLNLNVLYTAALAAMERL